MGMTPEQAQVWDLWRGGGGNLSPSEIEQHLGLTKEQVKSRLKRAKKVLRESSFEALERAGYELADADETPKQAWDSHVATFEREVAKARASKWKAIKRDGPFCIFHSTDEHVDDNKSALKLIEQDIAAAHELNSIMVHGGDVLNNWPVAGRLAKQWAEQQCTLPSALKRLQYFIEIFKPDVWIDGNHEEMNIYLVNLIDEYLPKDIIRDYWTARFEVKTPNITARCAVSHKFQKGSSWFHKLHGHLREMLEGEPVDLLMDGHLHSDGVLDQTLPERNQAALCVASAGYKVLDKYAARISKGGTTPKIRGRAHWIVCDDQAPYESNLFTAFKGPTQAEAYLSGLQNLRAV